VQNVSLAVTSVFMALAAIAGVGASAERLTDHARRLPLIILGSVVSVVVLGGLSIRAARISVFGTPDGMCVRGCSGGGRLPARDFTWATPSSHQHRGLRLDVYRVTDSKIDQ
jgi:hypothetical protein